MSDKKNWLERVDHILNRIDRIRLYVHNLSSDDFAEDSKVYDAVERCFEVIAEASRHIPDAVKKSYPDMPWQEISGMRNIIAHDYQSVEGDVLWDTVQKDLPVLEAVMNDIKAKSGKQ